MTTSSLVSRGVLRVRGCFPARASLLAGCLFLGLLSPAISSNAHAQSLRPALERRLAELASSSRSSLFLWDIRRGEILAGVRQELFLSPHCTGSLIKPFLALAYFKEHPEPAPFRGLEVRLGSCRGQATAQCPVECWYKPGHGRLELPKALAVSCNQYFYQVAGQTSARAFWGTLDEFGLQPKGAPGATLQPRGQGHEISPEMMMGLDPHLEFVPLQVLKAYLRVLDGLHAPRAAGEILLEALRLGAIEGTSLLAQRGLPVNQHLLGKTGTSPARVGGRYLSGKTDGWFLGFYPAPQPTLAVMVYFPNGLGARDAAPLGGKAIRAYLELVQ